MLTPSTEIRIAVDAQMSRIREALKDHKNKRAVARATGLHENTVRNIANGLGPCPSNRTIKKLEGHLFPSPARG
jgi:hypothetical protein